MATKTDIVPRAFIWRRVHSLTGLWFVLFLLEHLITNSQAALLLGDSGKGFVQAVNVIHDLPYLTVIEVGLLGVPILLHVGFGIKYALTAKPNSIGGGGNKPHLTYSRNRAYTWQRITSWILVVLLAIHVVKFRFLEYPETINAGTAHPSYLVKVHMDPGLYTVASRLGVELVQNPSREASSQRKQALEMAAKKIQAESSDRYNAQDAVILDSNQKQQEEQALNEVICSYRLQPGEVVAISPSFGTASLLTVRDTFKSWWWVVIYTIFVLSACFHAFNGLWTSMLTWGWVIKATAQTGARRLAYGLMAVIAFLGLAAVWGTYFLNLKQ